MAQVEFPELLKSRAGREDLLDLTREDLAYALLHCMQERRFDPIHPANRDSAVSELFSITDPISQWTGALWKKVGYGPSKGV